VKPEVIFSFSQLEFFAITPIKLLSFGFITRVKWTKRVQSDHFQFNDEIFPGNQVDFKNDITDTGQFNYILGSLHS